MIVLLLPSDKVSAGKSNKARFIIFLGDSLFLILKVGKDELKLIGAVCF